MFPINGIHDWGSPPPGELITWNPSPATLTKVWEAPVSSVPVSYQQAQHLRGYAEYAARGAEMARLYILAWDIPGRCDIRAMTQVINMYLRRHDTYHSWFDCKDVEHIVRRTIRDPKDIKLIPTKQGEITSKEWRAHVLATPDPLRWDCFHFGAIQRADHFMFYVSVDHVHIDGPLIHLVLAEIYMMYAALVGGAAPIKLRKAASYEDYCVRQHQYTSALTLESPEVRAWIEFAENNHGTLPHFPLPLGDPSVPSTCDVLNVSLMDEHQTDRFESACVDVGARFSGGVFACAALAEHELTGAETYYVITPTTTRRTLAEFATTGWFAGVVPITIPIGSASFGNIVRAAQASFDSGIGLANVPFDRVLELAPSTLGLRKPEPGVPMLSYLDASLPPLSPDIMAQWEKLNGQLYIDARSANQIGMWVNRSEKETTVTVMFPNNPVARESIVRYMDAMKSVYVRVAEVGAVAEPFAKVTQLDLNPA
jgi:mycolipenoyl-CoA---2-(long-chain-fatty acyl)-trehalose mycolipenoyltransferase / long-chain-acyl-CoA---trehalose acyltransferase